MLQDGCRITLAVPHLDHSLHIGVCRQFESEIMRRITRAEYVAIVEKFKERASELKGIGSMYPNTYTAQQNTLRSLA